MKKLLVFGFFLMLLLGCASQNENNGTGKAIVGVTIAPQTEFVERIGGNKVEAVLMVPPGASPHTYEPTPRQLEKISSADMYAKVGSGIEFEISWLGNLIDLNKEMLVVDCSEGIELLGTDPHIWLSPKNAKIMAENIYQGLVEVDPGNVVYYSKNKEQYLQELDGLDLLIENSIKGKENRKFIVYHPAWGYFADEYGLGQISIEDEGKGPTPKGIVSVIKQAKENNISVVFASPEYSISSAETISQEIEGNVLLISPLEKNYISNLEQVAETFKQHMK